MTHDRPIRPTPHTSPRRPCAAFTLVEMLIVIGVIVVLLGILIVGLNQATKRAQITHTQALMSSIKQALIRFKEDVGYYPPVLGIDRSLNYKYGSNNPFPQTPWEDEADYAKKVQTWSSVTTLAEYLIGYGHQGQDGYGYKTAAQGGPLYEDENPPIGIRHPGRDGVWGATQAEEDPDLALLDERNPIPPENGGPAKVYGPYLELHDDRLLAAPDPDDPDKVIFPGEAGFDEIDNRVIVDYWGNPIAYHRRLHPPGVLKQSYRALDPGINSFLPKLSDVICLRPYRVLPRQAADASFEDGSGDPTTSFALQSAEFALFSPGPDKMSDLQFVIDQGESRLPMRVDPNQYNRDNVVELGP